MGVARQPSSRTSVTDDVQRVYILSDSRTITPEESSSAITVANKTTYYDLSTIVDSSTKGGVEISEPQLSLAASNGNVKEHFLSNPGVRSSFPLSDYSKEVLFFSTSSHRLGKMMGILLKIVGVMLLGMIAVSMSLNSTARIILLRDDPRVLIISASQSGCGTEKGDDDILKSLKNTADYARKHNMDTWFSMELLVEPEYHRLRNKIVLLREVMRTQPNYDWYMWLDSDTLFTDMEFRIPWERYDDHSVVLFGDEKSIDTAPDYHESINMGVVYFRNDAFTRSFLEYMTIYWEQNPNQTEFRERVASRIRRLPGYVCDQGTVLYLLLTEPQRWRSRFFFELDYGINRYWKEESDHLEHYSSSPGAWRGDGLSPPFIVHFCGCALCWKKLAADFDTCQFQYERTYHFANDQILRPMGVRHRNLSSSEVVRLDGSELGGKKPVHVATS